MKTIITSLSVSLLMATVCTAQALEIGANSTTCTIEIVSDGAMDLDNGLTASNVTIGANGKWEFNPSTTTDAKLTIEDGSTITVNGILEGLRATGPTITGRTVFDNSGSGSYSITVASGGALRLQYFDLDNLNKVTISNGGRLVDMDEGTMAGELDVTGVDGTNRKLIPYSISNLTMSGAVSVRSGVTSPRISMLGGSGSGTEVDADERVDWWTGVVLRMTGDTTTDASYNTLRAGLEANTGGARLRIQENIILNDSINLDDRGVTGTMTLENLHMAPVQISATANGRLALDNTSSGAAQTMRNCIVSRGGLEGGSDTIDAFHCTLFPDHTSTSPTVGVSNVDQTSCITMKTSGSTAESGANLEVRETDADTYFAHVEENDFHLTASATAAIDSANSAPTYLADFEGHTRPYDDAAADATTAHDHGADEYQGALTVPTYFTTALTGDPDSIFATDSGDKVNLGKITRIQAYQASSGSIRAWAFTGGGAGENSGRDYRIYTIAYDGPTVLYYSAQFAGPMKHMTYWKDGANWRIYVVVDDDLDGFGDGIQTLTDSGSAFAAIDTTFGDDDGDDPTNGDGIFHVGGSAGKMTWLRARSIAAESDTSSAAYRLFTVKQKSGATGDSGTVFKINADTGDSSDGGAGTNRKYGMTIWEATSREYTYKGQVGFRVTAEEMYIPVSQDATTDIMVKMVQTGNTAPSVSSSWDHNASFTADANDIGPTLTMKLDQTILIYITSNDGDRLMSTTENAASDERRYTTVALAGNCSSQAFRFNNPKSDYVLLGVADAIEKIRDNGGITLADDYGPAGGDNTGGRTTDSPWPIAINGNVVYFILALGNKIYWATDEGYIYKATWQALFTDSDTEAVDTGFPIRLKGHVTFWTYMPSSTANEGLFVGTDAGELIRVPLN